MAGLLDKSSACAYILTMQSGAEQLRDWMKRRQVNLEEAAALLGWDPTFVSKLLNAKRSPGLKNAIQIERVTGISVEAWVSSQLDESDSKSTASGRNA